MTNNLSNLPYQIDFITSEIITDHELTTWLNDNSTHIENQIASGVTRYNFENFGKAIHALVNIKQHAVSKNQDLTYRLICLVTDSLYVQEGEFTN